MRATLVWTDPPLERLVNNLDLILVSPKGKEITAEDPYGAAPDNVNNVECIDVGNPQLGVWTLKVKATNIKTPAKDGTQPFAIVVSGAIE